MTCASCPSSSVTDGYCDECGMKQDRPSAPAASPVSGRCSCGSTGFTDGYCDQCGLAAVSAFAAEAPKPAAPAKRAVTGTTSGVTTISERKVQSGRTSVSSRTSVTHATAIGGGLVDVVFVPSVDPSLLVRAEAVLEENERFCSQCGKPVGRSRNGQPGRVKGFCPHAGCPGARDGRGQPYDFSATLSPGDVINGQYDVIGALAHGGTGWIYLAYDRNVSDRVVVLKGVLNTADAESIRAAKAERTVLAGLKHDAIVQIFNYVNHNGDDYIVMEYVGGKSLKGLLKDHQQTTGRRFAVDLAVAYVLSSLDAMEYLHERGLVFCDMKPDNLMQEGNKPKLIDVGGVRSVHDRVNTIVYGTVGYQAPEVENGSTFPTVASDIYTLGRTLLALCVDLPSFSGTNAHTIPPASELGTFGAALRGILDRCCDPNPARRFTSIGELRDQLTILLRLIVAHRDRSAVNLSACSFATTLIVAAAGADLTVRFVDNSLGATVPSVTGAPPPDAAVTAAGTPNEATLHLPVDLTQARFGGPSRADLEDRLRFLPADPTAHLQLLAACLGDPTPPPSVDVALLEAAFTADRVRFAAVPFVLLLFGDGGHLHELTPDTPEARMAFERSVHRAAAAGGDAYWTDVLAPSNLTEHDRLQLLYEVESHRRAPLSRLIEKQLRTYAATSGSSHRTDVLAHVRQYRKPSWV